MARTKPKKWIQDEIDSLDPDTDYDRIMKLNALYRATDEFQDIIYSMAMPNVVITNHGAETLFREGKGKAIHHKTKRMDHTKLHHLIWFEFGCNHEYTIQAIDSLNRLHKFWAQRFPVAFEPEEDYNYALAYEVTLIDRIAKRVGAPGPSERELRAGYNFYTQIQKHFRHALTDQPLDGWPESYEACLEFVNEIESRKRPPHKYPELVEEHLVKAFAERRMPKRWQKFGRDLVVSINMPAAMHSIGIEMPSPLKQAICRRAFRTYMWLGVKVAPDPEEHLGERIRAAEGWSMQEYLNQVKGGIKYHEPAADDVATGNTIAAE